MPLRSFAVFFIAICFALPASTQNSNSSSSNGSTSSAPAPAPTPDAAASAKAKAASAAAATVEQSLASYSALVLNASRYQKATTDITGSTSARPQSPIEDLRTLQTTVLAVQQNDLISAMTKAMASLKGDDSTTVEGKIKAACDDQDLAKSSQQDAADAKKACSKAQSDAADQNQALKTQLDALTGALGGVYIYVSNQAGLSIPKLDPLATLASASGTPDASQLLQKLPSGILALRTAMDSLGAYESTWNSLRPILTGLNVQQPKTDTAGNLFVGPTDQFNNLKDRIDKVLPKLSIWFASVNSLVTDDAGSLDKQLTPVGTDPAKNNVGALQAISDKATDLASAESIVSAWPALVGYLTDGDPDGFKLNDAKKTFNDLRRAVENLRTSSARLQDAIAGDASNFETAQVSLYYFFNVQQLMEALNGNVRSVGGVAEAQQAAAEQRKSLTATELDLADAQATVNKFQKQVLDLQEQQRQLRAKLKGQDSAFSKLTSRLQNSQDSKQGADDDVAAAQKDLNASPNDAAKSAALDKAKSRQAAAASKISQNQSDVDAAKADRDNTQAQLDGTQNQSDSLPAKIAAAQQALSESQTAVSQQRRRMVQAALAESDAFAFARDNTPFLFAPADASSTDPAKRVKLYAYVDSKTIFMRGKRDDINEVKQIIAEFDRPAPQARLTLWTFELSADSEQKTNRRAAKNLNKAMDIIDQELGDTRALENTTLAFLRDLINEEVRNFSTQGSVRSAPCSAGSTWGQNAAGATDADNAKLTRLTFYDPAVLIQLKFDPCNSDQLRRLAPDPAGTTTLGEALLVLSLARTETKAKIQKAFEDELADRLNRLPVNKTSIPITGWHTPFLPLTWHALGVWQDQGGQAGAGQNPTKQVRGSFGSGLKQTSGLSSSQLEITRALRTWYDSRVFQEFVDRFQALLLDYSSAAQDQSAAAKKIDALERNAGAGLKDPEKSELAALVDKSQRTPGEEARRQQLAAKGIRQFADPWADYQAALLTQAQSTSRLGDVRSKVAQLGEILKAYYNTDINDVSAALNKLTTQSADTRVALRKIVASLFGNLGQLLVGLNGASPRVAAADEMLKTLLIALEDDLSRDFVQPMIERLRGRLISQANVRVGIVQRESMLATNRGKARIDPKASAQLAVGIEEDILTGVQQLAQLYGVVQSGGALGVIGALQQQPREPAPEIYALTTGNKFEVTPVFDPSGQALRFKFDFVASTNLQEPNGSTSAQLPRIERHTINTEVQLSNLETREISRFESNARLGRPTEYSGGVPILKDIPYVRPWVPLVGWFVRKAGANAVAQQSVIFGQTTIYPTIGALIDLATDSGAQTAPSMQPAPPH